MMMMMMIKMSTLTTSPPADCQSRARGSQKAENHCQAASDDDVGNVGDDHGDHVGDDDVDTDFFVSDYHIHLVARWYCGEPLQKWGAWKIAVMNNFVMALL